MVFTIILGIIGIIYSALSVGGFPPTMELCSGFIVGALIDIYIVLKKRKWILKMYWTKRMLGVNKNSKN